MLRFARVCNHVADFNARNKCLTAKLLQQGYRHHKLRKTFSKFYRRHNELISKLNVGLKTLLREDPSEPKFYGDLVYKFKKLIGRNDFSFQFRKIITRYRRIGYNLNVMRQSTSLVFNPIMVDNYAAFLNCPPVGRTSDSMTPRHKAIHFSWLGPELLVCCLAHRGSTGVYFCSGFQYVIWRPGISIVGQLTESVESSFLIHQGHYHEFFEDRTTN